MNDEKATKPDRITCAPLKIAVVLQGDGALGRYQARVYAALSQAGYLPDWVAGIPIGGLTQRSLQAVRPKPAWPSCARF